MLHIPIYCIIKAFRLSLGRPCTNEVPLVRNTPERPGKNYPTLPLQDTYSAGLAEPSGHLGAAVRILSSLPAGVYHRSSLLRAKSKFFRQG